MAIAIYVQDFGLMPRGRFVELNRISEIRNQKFATAQQRPARTLADENRNQLPPFPPPPRLWSSRRKAPPKQAPVRQPVVGGSRVGNRLFGIILGHDGSCQRIGLQLSWGGNNLSTSVLANACVGCDEDGVTFRAWEAFDIPGSVNIASATLSIWNDGANSCADSSRTFTVYAASSLDWDGLVTGPALGTQNLGEADTGVSHWVDIPLNAAALSLLTTAEGTRFVFGGAINTINTSTIELFGGYTTGLPAARLTLETVPEPSAGLLGVGLGGLALVWRRRKS